MSLLNSAEKHVVASYLKQYAKLPETTLGLRNSKLHKAFKQNLLKENIKIQDVIEGQIWAYDISGKFSNKYFDQEYLNQEGYSK
jgi:hypothetical protein